MSILRLAPTLFGAVGGVVLWPTSVPLAIGVGVLGVIGSVLGGSSSDNLDLLIQRCKLGIDDTYSRVIHQEQNEIGTKYRLTIPTGMSIKHFISKQEEIQQGLGSDVSITLVNGYAVIQTITKQFKDKYSIDLSGFHGRQYKVGCDRIGQEVILDLSNSLHTLICGCTGSGKSVALNNLITQFIISGVELSLIDLKGGVEMVCYRRYKNLKGFACIESEAEVVLADTVAEMDRRYKLLFESEKKGFKDYNKSFPGRPMKQRIVVVDEYSALMDNKTCQKYLFDLMARARGCNISIIIATQSPRAEILPGRIRDNLTNYLVFKCSTNIASEVATGDKSNHLAIKLKGNGHGLLRCNDNDFKEFQGYYLSDSEIDRYIKPYLSMREPLQEQRSNVVPMPTPKATERIVEPKKAIDLDRINQLL